jgi:hypothetical protein
MVMCIKEKLLKEVLLKQGLSVQLVGHRSCSFVKDTFFSNGLLQFIEYNVN